MKVIIRVAFTVLILGFTATAGMAGEYRTPPHNYNQNNWMSHD
jgi:hypothetical protein